MKLTGLVIILFTFFHSKEAMCAQHTHRVIYQSIVSTDSTEIMLRKYKDWLEEGIISEDEYIDLKNKLLFNNEDQPKVNPESNLDERNDIEAEIRKIKNGFIPSTLTTVGGIGMLIGGTRVKQKEVNTEGKSPSEIAAEIDRNQRTGKTLQIAGGVITGIGVLMNAIFMGKLSKANSKRENLSFEFNLNSPTMASIKISF